jgi:two-component system sensor histidine kinase AlgZ
MPDTDPAPRWLPRFCSLPTLFAVMLVAELVVFIVLLAPGDHTRGWWSRLGVTSVFAQWLALLNAVMLCSLGAPLRRLSMRAGLFVAWLLTVVMTALASAVVQSLDRAAGLGLVPDGADDMPFVFANAAICALISAALLRYFHVLESWRQRVRDAADAKVDAMQARIRPHFLFNSMNTIASLIRTRPRDAERAVEDLSDLFRAALGADDHAATLGDELDLVSHYLHIEQLRLGERLRVDLSVADLPRELVLPRLLLQPLVENAVYHGIQPRAEGGTLSIHGTRSGDAIEITVRNPLPRDASPTGNGVALGNVRARLAHHFGARGGLRIEQGDGEFVVVARIPVAAS